MIERLLIVAGICSLVVVGYIWGAATIHYRIFPSHRLIKADEETRDFLKHWKNDLGIEPTRYLTPARPLPRGDVAVRPDQVTPGLRVVAGYFYDRPTTNAAVLLDEKGQELHFWPIDKQAIADRVGKPVFQRNSFLHALQPLPDGSVVVGFDGANVIARLDACGAVLWALAGRYHHLFSIAKDGTIWAVGGPDSIYAVTRIDSDRGEVLWSRDLISELASGAGKGALAIRRWASNTEQKTGWLPDPFHINDVDVLEDDLAPAFPLFDAGDLMMSLRNLNLVMVVDPDDGRIKWWQHGPWHRQHDPDFLPNGKISIYDNNMDGEASRIIEIDPLTRETTVVFEGSPEVPFYSWWRGNHQRLDNGNILMTEPDGGRVIEVDRDGALVWEYQLAFDDSRNLWVSNVTLLPAGFFEPGALACPDQRNAKS